MANSKKQTKASKRYDIEFLTGTRRENSCFLMEKFNFPRKVIKDFRDKDIVYMSLPDGTITTQLPDTVVAEIAVLSKTALVYHVIAGKFTFQGVTFSFYNLLFSEEDMMITNDYIWIHSDTINLDVPKFSEIGKIRIARNCQGMMRVA